MRGQRSTESRDDVALLVARLPATSASVLVEALADRWGVVAEGLGKRVRAELDLPPDDAGP
jgi:hypothetical protein